ncbi:MAG TPA: electron transport complex subunit E [Bacteroidales bacterium]|jgi:electron transport complex protein RnfE|nr:electron transport complex subunit E [Bacteroidales bacterium]HOS57024.1 electron transport complex subunit E [Bacteroidales bacterium]HPY81168.1 electron transport complex subunit E [Bacteroidales bacterium]HQA86665.1 electron transport complex subunit E [Bacteroidales bacterium]HRT13117.1 electron transport complex subunit E [Bacteroidales bacterium]
MNKLKIFTNGFIKENPALVLILGTCPALAVTTSAMNGLGMGLATTFVLVMSNAIISLLRNFIPDKVRIPAFIVIIATFVSIVDLLIQGFVPALAESLGIFIPLIVVNCIVLGRAEAFASKNTVFDSILDGLGMGLGFTLALFVMGFFRELLGNGAILGHKFIEGDGILIFVLAPGAFLVYGFTIALMNLLPKKKSKETENVKTE